MLKMRITSIIGIMKWKNTRTDRNVLKMLCHTFMIKNVLCASQDTIILTGKRLSIKMKYSMIL